MADTLKVKASEIVAGEMVRRFRSKAEIVRSAAVEIRYKGEPNEEQVAALQFADGSTMTYGVDDELTVERPAEALLERWR